MWDDCPRYRIDAALHVSRENIVSDMVILSETEQPSFIHDRSVRKSPRTMQYSTISGESFQ